METNNQEIYTKLVPFTICGHCIELSSTDKSILDYTFEDDEYNNFLCEHISEQLKNGNTKGDLDTPISWQVVIFNVRTERSVGDEGFSYLTGVFNTPEKAQAKMEEVIKQDIEINSYHKQAVENNENGYYTIEKGDMYYTVYETERDNNWFFTVKINKVNLQ